MKITELYAYVVVDKDGNEGVLRRVTQMGTQPLIGQSLALVEAFRPYAEQAAESCDMENCTLQLAHFVRTDP